MHPITNLKSHLTFLVALALVAQSSAMAAQKPLELKWSELSSAIQGRSIQLTLPDGTTVGGDVTVIRDESLVLNVHKTSDSKAFPKGNATIPRASVTVLNLIETRGLWGRKMGTSLGTLAGILASTYVLSKTEPSLGGGLATFGAITGSGALGGYYLGKTADSRNTLIRIVP